MIKYWIMDENGDIQQVPDVLAWGRWLEQQAIPKGANIVARTVVDKETVSTVLIGVGLPIEDPKPFETVILGGDIDGPMGAARWGHATKDEALAAHHQLVMELRILAGEG